MRRLGGGLTEGAGSQLLLQGGARRDSHARKLHAPPPREAQGRARPVPRARRAGDEEQGRAPARPGVLARLLSELCRRREAPVPRGEARETPPAAPAAAKAFSMLKRGEAVAIESVDGKVAVAAGSLEELIEKLLRS